MNAYHYSITSPDNRLQVLEQDKLAKDRQIASLEGELRRQQQCILELEEKCAFLIEAVQSTDEYKQLAVKKQREAGMGKKVNLYMDRKCGAHGVVNSFVKYFQEHVIPGSEVVVVDREKPLPQASLTLYFVHAVSEKLEGMFDEDNFFEMYRHSSKKRSSDQEDSRMVLILTRGLHYQASKTKLSLPSRFHNVPVFEFHYTSSGQDKIFVSQDPMNVVSNTGLLAACKEAGIVPVSTTGRFMKWWNGK